MKIIKSKFTILGILVLTAQLALAQEALKDVTTICIFDGKKYTVGNFETEEVYKANNYYISLEDMTEKQADSLKGKKILVTGKLKTVVGKTLPAKTSIDGKIYEPYREPDKKFILKPTFSIIYENKEPVNK